VSTYARRLAAFEARAALVDSMMADFVKEAERLVSYRTVLRLAYLERVGHEAENDDVFVVEDEERADELLALLPDGGA
jgi:hypothetical protein